MKVLQPHKRNIASLALFGCLIVYLLYYFFLAKDLVAIQTVDYWWHLDLSKKLSLADLNSLVHPFYPNGYLFLLRFGLASSVDISRYGQFLSLIGGLLGWLAAFKLIHQATGRIIWAVAGFFMIILHPVFQFHALREGNDMLAAGLQLVGIYFLFSMDSSDTHRDKRLIILAGILFGAAYLIRYTALLMIPCGLLYLWLQSERFIKPFFRSALLFGFVFISAASPQILPSLLTYGTPFYNEQVRNVWFGIYGNFNWVANWGQARADISVLQLISQDPGAVWQHWISEVSRFFLYKPADNLFQYPLALERYVNFWNPAVNHILWLTAAVGLLLPGKLHLSQRILLFTTMFLPVVVTALAFLFVRFLLLTLFLQVIVIVLSLSIISEETTRLSNQAMFVSILLLGVLYSWFLYTTELDQKMNRAQVITERIQAINTFLYAVGSRTPEQVISNNRLLQDIGSPTHDRYHLFIAPRTDTDLDVDTLLTTIAPQANQQYFIFDWTTFASRNFAFDRYRPQLEADKVALVPLQLNSVWSIFCRYPCTFDAMQPGKMIFDGLHLVAYKGFSSDDSRQKGLYLYWEATQLLSRSYQVSLTVLDRSNQPLYQTVRVPQLGTYPTNGWPVAQIVPDFYTITLSQPTPHEDYRLGLSLIEAAGGEPVTDVVHFPLIFK